MKDKEESRRRFIRNCWRISTAFLAGGLVLSACGSKESTEKESLATIDCDDLSGVSEDEILKREKFGYVKKSPIPESQCGNCSLYVPSGADKDCGKCMLFEGPVYESAYCTYWAPQV